MKLRTGTLLLGITYAGAIFLGLSNGALGVAWPAIRGSFGIPLDAVGTLLTAVTIGYIAFSFSSGRIISAIGLGRFLLVGSVASGVGLLGYAAAPAWWVVVLFGLLVGVGAGAIDSGVNVYVAAHYRAKEMNWLHGCFGIGVTLGPALMTALLNVGLSWRWGYALVVLLQGLLAIFIGLNLDRWADAGPTSTNGASVPSSRPMASIDTLRLPVAWLGIALFVTHPGIQFTAGNWAYSLFTEARAVDPIAAGIWTSVFWGCLTAGRLLFGPVADRFGADSLLRACIPGVILGSLLIWWNVANPVSFLGLALMGFSLAPLFPTLISGTANRVGAGHAPNLIGFQIAAGSLGAALLPALAGVLARNLSLEAIGPYMFAASLVLLLLHEVLVRRSR